MSVLTHQVKDHVAYITLNRPDKLNAINAEMRNSLFESFTEVRNNPDIWVAIITGTGRAFSTGADLVELAAQRELPLSGENILQFIQETWKPTIVAINGLCLAQGAGIALACDIRIASEKAQFSWPQVKRGIPSISGPAMLCHQISMNLALEIMYLGDLLDAKEAYRINLVNRVVPHGRLLEAAEEVARKILKNAPLATRAIKEGSVRGLSMNMEDRILLNGQLAQTVRQSVDAQEGLDAFREKRQPVWQCK